MLATRTAFCAVPSVRVSTTTLRTHIGTFRPTVFAHSRHTRTSESLSRPMKWCAWQKARLHTASTSSTLPVDDVTPTVDTVAKAATRSHVCSALCNRFTTIFFVTDVLPCSTTIAAGPSQKVTRLRNPHHTPTAPMDTPCEAWISVVATAATLLLGMDWLTVSPAQITFITCGGKGGGVGVVRARGERGG